MLLGLKKAAFLGFCISLVVCATIQTSAAQEDFLPALTKFSSGFEGQPFIYDLINRLRSQRGLTPGLPFHDGLIVCAFPNDLPKPVDQFVGNDRASPSEGTKPQKGLLRYALLKYLLLRSDTERRKFAVVV